MESTADLQETADLSDEDIADGAAATANDNVDRIDTAALPLAPMPKQRAFGFFAFMACALLALIVVTRPPAQSPHSGTEVGLAGSERTSGPEQRRFRVRGIATDSHAVKKLAETPAAQSTGGKRESAETRATLGIVTFASRSFTTSERAMAAVFIVRRTQAVRGGAVVQWAAHSGSADAGIDFSDASGTVRFADGQRERAIYVPLRNDLLKEEDETFQVCLRSPRQVRIGGMSCAEATIRDDDRVSNM